MSPRSQILGLVIPLFIAKIVSLVIDVFTPKWVSPDCHFKSNQRPAKFSILPLWCAVWHHCFGMHTAELDSVVWCTVHSAHPGAWHRRGLHTVESDSTVGCTPRSFLKFSINLRNLNQIRLACSSVAKMGSNHEQNRGRKSRDTLPLSNLHSSR